MSSKELTKEQCLQWKSNPNINPLTGRKIKTDGPLARQFKARCEKLLDEKIDGIPCSKVWIKLTHNEATVYGRGVTITCKSCGQHRFLHAVHKELGDYSCQRCDTDVDLAYFCYSCHNQSIL